MDGQNTFVPPPYPNELEPGETDLIGSFTFRCRPDVQYGTWSGIVLWPSVLNAELKPQHGDQITLGVLVGPPPPVLSEEAVSAHQINLSWYFPRDEHYYNGGQYVCWKNEYEDEFKKIAIPSSLREYELEVPHASTEYQVYVGALWTGHGVPDAPPYEGFSETATDTTFPYLSSRSWDFFSGPEQNKVVYDPDNNRYYLVLVDQGKVWFSYSTNGGMSWSEHIPISGNIKNLGSPAIADFDGGVGVVFLDEEKRIYYTYAENGNLDTWTDPQWLAPNTIWADIISFASSGNTAVLGYGDWAKSGESWIGAFSFEFNNPGTRTMLLSKKTGFKDIGLAVSENGQGRLFVSDDFNIVIYGGPIDGSWQEVGSVSAYISETTEPYLTATSTGDNFIAAATTGTNQILIVHDASGWQTGTIMRPDQLVPVTPHLSANGQGDFTLLWAENNNGRLGVWKADGTLNGGLSLGNPSKVGEASNFTAYGAYFLNPHGVRPFLDKILVFHEDTVNLPPYELKVHSMLEALIAPSDVVIQAISSEEIQVSWLNNCSAAYIKVEYTQERDGLPLPGYDEVPCTGKGTRQSHIIDNLKPSAEYTIRLIAVDQQGEAPTGYYTAITHPHLSARVPFSLDPSNSSKFVESRDKVYLVHEDQDRVWLAFLALSPYLMNKGFYELRGPQNPRFWPQECSKSLSVKDLNVKPLPDKNYRIAVSESLIKQAFPRLDTHSCNRFTPPL
ncbi:MAG: fibronectin type III domain-containing protein [candidate division WOR-3 bacterium]